MTLFDLNAQASRHVKASLLAKEEGLKSKWFDYRPLHPVTATAVFASAYSSAFREASMLRVDCDEGAKILGLKRGNSLFDHPKATITGLWTARQYCDEKCMPYDAFCGIAMSIATNCGWAYLPRPTQLYSEDLLIRIQEEWDDRLTYDPPYATHEWYAPDRFENLPSQIEYFDYLEKLVRGKAHPEYLLHSLLHHGRISARMARERFGECLTLQAEQMRILSK